MSKIDEFVKDWYRPGIDPSYQLSNKAEIEKEQMKSQLESELIEFTNWLSKVTRIHDPKGIVKMYLKSSPNNDNKKTP